MEVDHRQQRRLVKTSLRVTAAELEVFVTLAAAVQVVYVWKDKNGFKLQQQL